MTISPRATSSSCTTPISSSNQSNSINGLRLFTDGSTGDEVRTNAGTLTVTDTITVTPNSVGGGTTAPLYAPAQITATNGGLLDLGASRIVMVNANLVNGIDVAPLQSGLTISAPIINTSHIVKQGLGVLQLDNSASTFSGGVDLQAGTLSIGGSSIPNSSSPIASGPLGTGTLTISGSNTMILAGISAPTIWNTVQMTGATNGTLNFNIAANGTSTILVANPVTLTFAGAFQLPFTAANSTLNIGVINPNLTVVLAGNITAAGGQTFENSGTINKTGLGNLVLNASFQGTVTGTGPISLFTDGNLPGPIPAGTSTPETVAFGAINMTGPTTLNVGRLGITYAPLYPMAANKTVSLTSLTLHGALTIGNSVANTAGVSGGGGYGLQVLGTTTLSSNQVITVTTATASNVVQGLTLSGMVTGNAGTITLAGPGTVVLDGATSDFIGNITVNSGVLGATSNGALGNTANTITLNGSGTTTAGFEAFGSFSTARTINLGATAADNLIMVARDQTLTLNGVGQLTGANGFIKADPGTLKLTAVNSGYTGAVTINGGVIQVTADHVLGNTPGTVTVGNFIGSAFQLAGGVTYTGPLNISNIGDQQCGRAGERRQWFHQHI